MTVQFKPRTGRRGIEWCDITVNPLGGCPHKCRWLMPDGTVAICYAEMLAESGVAKSAYPHGFNHHYWRSSQLDELTKGDESRLIFCGSMTDMFSAAVPQDQVRRILAAMRETPHHTYQTLTKAAPQLLKYMNELPSNLWVGVSSPPDWFMDKRLTRAQQAAMLKRSLDVLAIVKEQTGHIVWMSAEPVSWDLTSVIDDRHPLDWIVIGAASSGRRYFQPEPIHVRRLLDILDHTGTPVFFKGNLGGLFEANDLGNDRLNRWREDFPLSYHDGRSIPAVARRQKQCEKWGWTRIALRTIESS